MSRLTIPESIADAPHASQSSLEAVQGKLGMVPNLFRLVGNNPAALKGYLSLTESLTEGILPLKLQEAIALAIAETNRCTYCLSAHSFIAANLAKVPEDEINSNRKGLSDDAKTQVALQFAVAVAELNGRVNDQLLNAVKQAGFSDAEIIEIILHVALNTWTNSVNNVADTEVDFPLVIPF